MRFHKDAKVELIRHVPLFANCSKKDLRQIASLADELDFPAGKVLIREGRPGSEFFVIVEGRADVSRDGQSIDTLESGDFCGEVALLSGHPRNATVTTLTPVLLLIIFVREFRSLLADQPDIQRKLLVALADRLAPDAL